MKMKKEPEKEETIIASDGESEHSNKLWRIVRDMELEDQNENIQT